MRYGFLLGLTVLVTSAVAQVLPPLPSAASIRAAENIGAPGASGATGSSGATGTTGSTGTTGATGATVDWQILGNGYAQLTSGTDPSAAFSIAVSRTGYVKDKSFATFVAGASKGASLSPSNSSAAGATFTTQADFARFVLTPTVSPFSGYLSFEDYETSARWGSFQPGVYLGTEIGAGTISPANAASKTAVVLAIHADFAVALYQNGLPSTGSNSVLVSTKIGLTTRTLLADAWQGKDYLVQNLGSPQRAYFGPEFGWSIKVNSVSLGLTIPLLIGHVSGVTNGQFVPSVTVGGAVDLTNLPK